MRNINRWVLVCLSFTVVACWGVQASAQSAQEKAIRARQSAYHVMGHHMGLINAMIKGDLPFDKTSLQLRAQTVDLVGRLVGENFPSGSDKGNTKAKPNVWKDAQRFKELALASQAETAKLLMATNAGELDDIKTAYGSTSKSCKSCHDEFKAK
jgi:cytochrome c556